MVLPTSPPIQANVPLSSYSPAAATAGSQPSPSRRTSISIPIPAAISTAVASRAWPRGRASRIENGKKAAFPIDSPIGNPAPS